MKALLSQARLNSLKDRSKLKKTNAVKPLEFTNCTRLQIPEGAYSSDFAMSYDVTANQPFCIQLEYSQLLLVFGSGLKFEGQYINETGETATITKENGYGAMGAMDVRITPSADGKVQIYSNNVFEISEYDEYGGSSDETVSIGILKSQWEGSVTYKAQADDTSSNSYSEELYVINPNTTTFQAQAGRDAVFRFEAWDLRESGFSSQQLPEQIQRNGEQEGEIVAVHPFMDPSLIDESMTSIDITASVDVTVTSSTTPDNFPNKVIKFEEKTLYGYDDDDFEDFGWSGSSGLTGGEIAGIVIACIVVVGIAAFCIVWFVVLKKPCFCGGKDSPSA